MKATTTNSWLANKLFKLRDEVFTWIKMKVGNGESCRFWSDNWSPFGNLSQFILTDQTSRMGIDANSTVSDLFIDGRWMIPPARSEKMVQLHIFFTTFALTDTEDCYEWVIDDKPTSRFNTSQVYQKLRGQEATVTWAQSVWITGGIPRHSFLTWLFVLNRCPTRDRLRSWGLQTDVVCLLCNQEPETRDHLYFHCPFSFAIWEEIGRRCDLQPLQNWDQTMIQMQSLQGNKYKKRLTLLCWQSSIYWIWQERNKRLHNQQFRSPEAIISLITRQITDRISAYRLDSPAISSIIMQLCQGSDTLSTGTDDAKVCSATVLEALAKVLSARAREQVANNAEMNRRRVQQQVEALIKDNAVLKRAVAIQHERRTNSS
ncbi:uncharacterized protein LOC117126867 [Brassica rapa]|uniref:uncharacterized protein LOC117126867 n=1 Tax=Brassica campestris TaxID=3711 RepID=UPI00142D3D4D|nr:uncharacterized protein LOC117126867 [Brassica rapa]